MLRLGEKISENSVFVHLFMRHSEEVGTPVFSWG